MHRMQGQTRVVEPLRQRDGGAAIAIVEVIADRKHFNRIEAMRGYLDEVIAIEAIGDVQMRGNAEHGHSTLKLTSFF